MKPKLLSSKRILSFAITFAVAFATGSRAADQYFDGTATNALTAAKWAGTNSGPFTGTFTTGNTAVFATVNGTGTGAGGITVAGIRAEENFILNSPSGTLATGGTVATVDVFTGKILDLGSLSISTAAGTGFIKNGNGAYASAGGSFTGGFTLNAGTVILRGVNAMGAGGALTLNGGTVAGSATRDLTGKYTGGIVVGGNVQFGELAANLSLASDTGNLTFSNNMSLGGATRTLTLGNGGNVALGGIISNTGGVGLSFAATAGGTGRFDITNSSNTYIGTTTITAGEVRFTADGSLGTAPGAVTGNSIVIDGGRFATLSGATYTLNANRGIQVGAAAGSSISTPGAGVLTYNGIIADKTGTTGAWAKQGGGTLALGGVSTYTGSTAINNGILRLTTGNDRLPTGTVVSLGQTASTNLGTLDLNGRNQQIGGLQSTAGTNATASTNVVTSATASTLTINCSTSTSYTYSVGTNANSGIISGAVSLSKIGDGTQILGGANSYTGTTTVGAGRLIIDGFQTGAGTVTVQNGGTLGGDGSIAGSLHFDSGANFLFNPLSIFTVNGSGNVINFDNFGITNLAGLDATVAEGTYTLIDGAANFSFANVANFGAANAYDLGGGKSAYFQAGSLQVVVIPEPAAVLLGSLGFLTLLRRRRA
ncbi:MAG: autotransporter-associated beta strand repeat-containing protein [Luteolibacter sp.]|uniref:beta strand repeat-containing protein n=1 Tax=Luteolibacter sp. TaxID=1962973 RepID=UPI0032646DBF